MESCSVKVYSQPAGVNAGPTSDPCSRDDGQSPSGCYACGIARDDGVTANDDYDPTIVGAQSHDVDKVRLSN